MKSPAQLSLLQDFYRDRLALMHRHIEGAKRIADYEFNNTYQYVIGREEIHVQWLRDVLVDLGAEVPADPDARVAWLFDTWQELDGWVGAQLAPPTTA